MIKKLSIKKHKILLLIQQVRKYHSKVGTTFFLGILIGHDAVSNEAVYVTDEFSIPLRAGPEVNERVLRTKIISGSKLRKLDEPPKNDYIKVQTSRGEIGWLPAEFVVTAPPSKLLLDEQKQFVKTLRSELKTAREQADLFEKRAIETNDNNLELEKRVATLETELADIKALASDTIKINQDNSILKQTNQRLKDSILQLTRNEKSVSDTSRYLDFLLGGGLVVVGLVIGLILNGRRKSTGWTN